MEELIERYTKAKEAETKATQARVEAGNRLAEALGAPDEGSKTHEVGRFKVTLRQPINRRVDWELFDGVLFDHPPCRVKRELDEPGLKWIRENEPEAYAQYCRAITSKPGRVSVTIKEAEGV